MRRPLILALAVAACTTTPATPDVRDEPLPESLDEGERVELDRRGDDVLHGVLVPVLEHTDAGRTLTIDSTLTGRLADALDGLVVQDARFVGFGVVVIDADHALVAYDEAGNARVLDHEAHGPLSVAEGVVAYTRGSPPDLELVRAYPSRGVVEPLTTDMAPVWSPALSDDGREVVFVSGAAGLPRLHRLTASGAIAALPVSARFPSAPSAPIWRGTELVFEDERGVVALDLPTGDVLEALDGAHAPSLDSYGSVTTRVDGARVVFGGAR
ncbi:MAG: hypothetical protein JJ863_11030 [Deltaproteobacteria bacterium]|nr:hypothetical protein [Deltaproteobacteria bacterium]